LEGPWLRPAAAADGLSSAQRQSFLSRLDTLMAEFRRLPVFNPPRGVYVRANVDLFRSWMCQSNPACVGGPMTGRISLIFWWYFGPPGGGPGGNSEACKSLEFNFNDPGTIWDERTFQDATLPDGRLIAWEPVLFRKDGPVPVYFNQRRGGVYAFLVREDRPLWVPVSQQELLEALIRVRQAYRMKETARERDPAQLQTIERLSSESVAPVRAALAAMSPAERAAQAWTRTASWENPLVKPHTSGARPLVAFNPEVIDRTRPRTDIQFIVVRLGYQNLMRLAPTPPKDQPIHLTSTMMDYCDDVAGARMWEFFNQLDWAHLRTLMK
jgi:hypothetical protein